MLTIFTPTYNRAEEIKRLYNSLKQQNNKDFEWIVIDDGSSDNTAKVMAEILSEKILDINFSSQENSGKMKAHNRGVEKARGELFVCVDADDWLTPDAVGQIMAHRDKIGDSSVAGMLFNDFDGISDKIVGSQFPWDEKLCSYYDVYNKEGVTGDKTPVFKTDVLKEFPFPEIEGEKFVPEALVNYRISDKYVMLCINVAIKRVEYLADGYSNNYFNICRKNPIGQTIYYRELYLRQPTLYNAAAYDMYCIYGKISIVKAIKEHPCPAVCLLMYIPAYIKYLLKERK